VDAFCKLVPREGLRRAQRAEPETRPIDLDTLTDDDLRNLSDAELAALQAEAADRIAAEEKAAEPPMPG